MTDRIYKKLLAPTPTPETFVEFNQHYNKWRLDVMAEVEANRAKQREIVDADFGEIEQRVLATKDADTDPI